MTEGVVGEAKRLYGLVNTGKFGDDSNGIQNRVRLVEELERLTSSDFKDTGDFHRKVSAFIARRDNDGSRLREKRNGRGWSLAEMGIHLGVSKQYVAEMEAGRKPLNDNALAYLSSTKGPAV